MRPFVGLALPALGLSGRRVELVRRLAVQHCWDSGCFSKKASRAGGGGETRGWLYSVRPAHQMGRFRFHSNGCRSGTGAADGVKQSSAGVGTGGWFLFIIVAVLPSLGRGVRPACSWCSFTGKACGREIDGGLSLGRLPHKKAKRAPGREGNFKPDLSDQLTIFARRTHR